jgi:hypothetical protein
MDPNTQLILANAVRVEKWEDRENATNDVEALMKEVEKRLPSRKNVQTASGKQDQEESRK